MAKKRSNYEEWIKNLVLILLALGVIVFFFNQDFMRKGESVFSRKAQTKLYFRGDLNRQAYAEKEIDQLLRYLKKNAATMESATVETRLQDAYKKVTNSSQLLFEVHLVMRDGAKISTTARRSTRGSLVNAILSKVDKDVRVYKKMKKSGKKIDSLINAN